jgi:hypothetical protein
VIAIIKFHNSEGCAVQSFSLLRESCSKLDTIRAPDGIGYITKMQQLSAFHQKNLIFKKTMVLNKVVVSLKLCFKSQSF